MAVKRDKIDLASLVAAVEQAADSIVITDTMGAIQYVNPAFSAMTGYTSAEAVGQNPRVLKSGKQPTEFYKQLWDTIISGQRWHGELVNRRKDGTHYCEEMQITPVRNSLGEIVSFIAIKHDVTERRASEDTKAFLATIVEATGDAIVACSPDGMILSWNRGAELLSGFKSEEVIGHPATAYVLPEYQSLLADCMRRTAGGESISRFEVTCQHKGGLNYTASLIGSPIKDSDGQVTAIVAIMHDVTERRASEDAKAFLATIVENSEDAIIGCTPSGVIKSWNRGAEALLGYKRDEMIDNNLFAFTPPGRQPLMAESIRRVSSGGTVSEYEGVCLHRDGRLIDVSAAGSPIKNSHGLVTSIVATMHNISKRKRAEEALLFKTALLEGQMETSLDGILIDDEANVMALANRQFQLIFGIPRELMNSPNNLLLREHAMNMMVDAVAFREKVEYLNHHREEKSKDELRLKNGVILDRYSSPLVDSAGKYRGRIWYFRDITARKAAEERSQFLAMHDALTGLPLRALLEDRLNNALAAARRRHEKVAVLFCDINRFKNINDTFGHSSGDEVLKEVARRLLGQSREQDTVARLGGDEFLVILNGVKDIAGVAIAAERLLDAMKPQFLVQGQALDISCSIGISIFPEHGADGETLVKNADEAMYSAKAKGRGNVMFFTDLMNVQVTERLDLEKNLKFALDRKEFFLMYQPQMNIASGAITGLEALIRWQQPEMGLVGPDRFISIAENIGLILPIGEWVLRTACAQAREWMDAGLIAVPVAVNVSAVQFRQDGFPALIRKVLSETGLPPRFLELELTEGVLLSQVDLTFAVLRELKAIGVRLAIDDFGTGYSSLSYLKHFHVSTLKIDRSFILDMAADSDDTAIIVAILAMAKSMKLKVIGEGVENKAQLAFLRKHGCDEIQGHYFSRPLTADEFVEKLQGLVGCRGCHTPDALHPGGHLSSGPRMVV